MKQKFKRFTNILVLGAILLLTFAVIRSYVRVQKAKTTIEEARIRVEKQKNEEGDLKKQLEQAETDEFIEKQLRDKLGFAKEGEVILVLPDENAVRALAPKRVQEEEYEPEANWKKWKDLFF